MAENSEEVPGQSTEGRERSNYHADRDYRSGLTICRYMVVYVHVIEELQRVRH